MPNVRPEELSIEIIAQLREYSRKVADGMKEQCKKVAKETVSELKQTSPKKTGKYAAGWAAKIEFESSDDVRISVRNKNKPQITHLLEYGHKGKHGIEKGSAPAKPHINPARDAAAAKLVNGIKVVTKA